MENTTKAIVPVEPQEIAVASSPFALPVEQFKELLKRAEVNRREFRKVMRRQLKEGVHFYKIEGADKPAMGKAGAEVVAELIGRVPRYQILYEECDIEKDLYRVCIKASLASRDGEHGGGDHIAYASSLERRHRNTLKKMRERDPSVTIEEIRHNILQMAQKRALVGAVLNVSAASDLFTMDIEDAPELVQNAPEMAQKAPKVTPAKQEVKKCPKCGRHMSKRTRKDGSGSFYGCNGYPKCTYTEHISETEAKPETKSQTAPQVNPETQKPNGLASPKQIEDITSILKKWGMKQEAAKQLISYILKRQATSKDITSFEAKVLYEKLASIDSGAANLRFDATGAPYIEEPPVEEAIPEESAAF